MDCMVGCMVGMVEEYFRPIHGLVVHKVLMHLHFRRRLLNRCAYLRACR